jgi:subtilisin family serine protease
MKRDIYAIVTAIMLSACGKQQAPSDGVIAVSDDGTVDLVTEAEAVDFCKDKFCEPNYVINLEAADTSIFRDYARPAINLQEAWTRSTGASVTVAVIDTGVDLNHPALKDSIAINAKELAGKSGTDDDGNGLIDDIYGYNFVSNNGDVNDDNYHGTHCSGLVVANGSTSKVWGVAPGAKLLPIKVLNNNGAGTVLNGTKGIYYAVSRGAKVISMSWGTKAYSKILDDAVQYAIKNGVTVVAAAGNNGQNLDSNPFFPASSSGVISVGSVDSNGLLSFFSSFGKSVTIMAPGSLIISTTPGGKYTTVSGTSMATPQVAGAIALKLAVTPSASPSSLKKNLCDSANKSLLDRTECGTLNVGKMVK